MLSGSSFLGRKAAVMAGDPDGAGPRAGDALSEFARALTGACALGSAILNSMAGLPDRERAAAVFAPLIEPFRRADSAANDASMAQDCVDIASFLGQTWMVAASSGLRYWWRLAGMYGEHQAGLLQALMSSGLSEDERRAMIDELRAYVRGLGDVSLQEARVLQSELERLSHGLAAGSGLGSEHGPHRRRWRAKP
jgi:hypothetical protein